MLSQLPQLPGRILALLDHPADKLDQVGADLERHGESVLLVLLGEQPFGLDLLGPSPD